MTKEQLMEMGLEEEMAEKVAEAVKGELDAVKLDAAIDRMLMKNGARCLPAVKAMLKMEAVGFSAEGQPVGVQEQIDALRRDAETAFLFAPAWDGFRGVQPGEGMDGEFGGGPAKMSYAELCAYLEEHPEAKL